MSESELRPENLNQSQETHFGSMEWNWFTFLYVYNLINYTYNL